MIFTQHLNQVISPLVGHTYIDGLQVCKDLKDRLTTSVMLIHKLKSEFTCFEVPFPYNIMDSALWTRHIRWWRDFNSWDATIQRRGFFLVGSLTILLSKSMRVGSFDRSSSITVSQLKFLTASTVQYLIMLVTAENTHLLPYLCC